MYDNDLTTKYMSEIFDSRKSWSVWKSIANTPKNVDIVKLYLDEEVFSLGYYGPITIQMQEVQGREWKLCKGPLKITKPLYPLEIRCNDVMWATRVRVWMDNCKQFSVYELEVDGKLVSF